MPGPTNSEIASAVSTPRMPRKLRYWNTAKPLICWLRYSDSSNSIQPFSPDKVCCRAVTTSSIALLREPFTNTVFTLSSSAGK